MRIQPTAGGHRALMKLVLTERLIAVDSAELGCPIAAEHQS
jgi:hypothetical protein